MATGLQLQLAEDLLRRISAAVRATQLYSAGHSIVLRNLEALTAALQMVHMVDPRIVIGIVGEQIVVGDTPVSRAETFAGVVERLTSCGIERLTIDRGVAPEEIARFVTLVAAGGRDSDGRELPFDGFTHIRVGRLRVEPRVSASLAEMSTVRRLYAEAVRSAEDIWDSAQTEQRPDATITRSTVDGLAEAVSQNRRALVALTTLKNYDNYTFTHMVNVSVLTMGQARALGIDGALLREIGLAALMHDIGKVRTPVEILNKPDKLTDAEFTIMKRHTVDGAEMLRQTPDIPTLAPVVAFEHHLRLDGTGYPTQVSRPSLNLATMICSIADVFDAMRSQRAYQQAFPTDRILKVLERNDGQQFDQHLVRRFVQLIGIYPAGSLVRLSTGAVAVVTRVHAPDPYRPQVRLLTESDGTRLDTPPLVNLWDAPGDGHSSPSVVMPLDPAEHDGWDPLALM